MAANKNCAWTDYTCMRTYNVSSPVTTVSPHAEKYTGMPYTASSKYMPRTLRCRHYAWRLPVQTDIDACMKVKLPYSAAPDALGDFEGNTSHPSATLTSLLPAGQPKPAVKPTDPGTWWTKKAQSGLEGSG